MISKVNEREWEGLSEKLFEVRSKPPSGSTIVCKSCNVPPSYVVVCTAKIYYVIGTPHMTRACVHLGSHDRPVKSGDHRDFIDLTDTLIGDQVKRISSATCEAKPTTLKRLSPGDGFENHIHSIETCGNTTCNFHIRGHPHHLKSRCFY